VFCSCACVKAGTTTPSPPFSPLLPPPLFLLFLTNAKCAGSTLDRLATSQATGGFVPHPNIASRSPALSEEQLE